MASQDEYQQQQFFNKTQEQILTEKLKVILFQNKDAMKQMNDDIMLGIPLCYRVNKNNDGGVVIQRGNWLQLMEDQKFYK